MPVMDIGPVPVGVSRHFVKMGVFMYTSGLALFMRMAVIIVVGMLVSVDKGFMGTQLSKSWFGGRYDMVLIPARK